MTQTVLLKRSATPAKIPATTDLALGEIGINTYDGKMYIKKNNGSDAIVQIGGGSSVGSSFTNVNSSFTAVAGTAYLVDTTVNTITITLPASPTANDTIILVDYLQNSQTNNITISRNGNKINNLSEDLIVDYNGITVQLTYYSGNWVITNTGGINNAGYVQTTEYTATAGQSLFSVTYPSASALMVFVNGVQMSLAGGDYTASTGTSVTLTTALSAGVHVKFVTFNNIGNYPTVSSSEFTATAGQTTFPFTYNPSSGISGLQVFKNGIQLSSSQYTASNGTSVILGTACAVNDKIRLMGIQAATTSISFNQWASPALTGTATAPTVSTGDSSTNIATTAFVQSALTQSGALAGFRNLVINGDMKIAQRTTSGALTTTTSYLSLDRWAAIQAGTANGVLAQVASGLTGFQYAAKIGRNSGATTTGVIALAQAFETVSSVPWQGQTVTFSFYAKAGTNYSGGALTSSVYTGTGTDQSTAAMSVSWTGSATPLTSGVTLTTTWQRFTITGTISSTATQIGINFAWTPVGTAGADDNVYITGVQLEQGSYATPFEIRPFTTELQLCQRYYTLSGFNVAVPSGGSGVVTVASVGIPVQMRSVAPTFVEGFLSGSGVSAAAFAISGGFSNYQVQLTSNTTIGNPCTRSSTISVSSEL